MQDKPKRATIHDVARRAGLSAATVSKVLNGVSTVKADNADRVRSAIEELDFRLDPLASGLRNEQRRIIGVVVPDLESPFFGALVTHLERLAQDAGYHVIITSSRESEEREEELVARINDWRVAGTILIPARSERGLGALALRGRDMNAVLVDRVVTDGHFDTVTADNFEASASVADFLLDQGHKHMLVHGATKLSKAVRTRLDGFSERARSRDPGVQIDELLSDNDLEAQRDAISTYFESHAGGQQPTAVFSLSQHSALLMFSELRRRDIRIPQEIALVSFDDADWMQTSWPTVSAVVQPVEAIAERALSVLLARINGENNSRPVHYMEPCTMQIRQSTGQQ